MSRRIGTRAHQSDDLDPIERNIENVEDTPKMSIEEISEARECVTLSVLFTKLILSIFYLSRYYIVYIIR